VTRTRLGAGRDGYDSADSAESLNRVRDHLATRTPRVEQVESYCESECDNDELLL